MSKKVSMQQIADRLGLSKYSVSQALAGKPGVSEENRLRIEETARAMGYKVRPSGRTQSAGGPRGAGTADEQPAGSEGASGYILVWIHSLQQQDSSFWSKVLSGIASGSKEQGYEHLIIPVPPVSHGFQLQVPAYVNRASCVGHILVGTFPSPSIVSLKQTGLPVVLADHDEPLVEVDCVLNNNLDSGKMACKRLLSAGCQRIVFVGDDAFAVSFKERWWGCRLAMEEAELPAAEASLKKWTIAYGRSDHRLALERRLTSLELAELPDGFICANDHLALDLLSILKKKGVEIPARTKVIGFDNIDSSAYCSPPLSTVELGKESLGIRAVEALLYRMEHSGRQAEKIVLSSRFIVRESG